MVYAVYVNEIREVVYRSFHQNCSNAAHSFQLDDGIGVGRIRTFPFLPIPFTTPSLMIQ